MIQLLLNNLKISIVESIILIGGLIAVGLILGLFERETNKNVGRALGWNGILLTAWLGTPLHELGHAFMAILFRHKIVEIKLLQSGREDGTLGYVNHSYDKHNLYQRVGNFFIALGPLFSGTLGLLVSMYFLLPNSFSFIKNSILSAKYAGISLTDFLQITYDNLKGFYLTLFNNPNIHNPRFWIFILIALCICSHIAMSKPDLKGMEDGVACIVVALFVINVLATLSGFNGLFGLIYKISYFNFYVLYIASVSILFSILTYLVSLVISALKR